MSEFAHISVLAAEVVAYLEPRAGGLYCDGTLGAAGHAQLVLERSAPDGRLIGIDRDRDALAAAERNLAGVLDRVTLIHGTFGDIAALTPAHTGGRRFDGIVLDLGLSSPQLDHAERGFSFMREGPIDMRMDQSQGETAFELMRRLDKDQLSRVLRDLGEERFHKRIAANIKEALKEDRLRGTTALAALVDAAIPAGAKRRMKIHPATKTFQALRIAVNSELEQLSRFLDSFPELLSPGGRCVVISFHSLEDRLVKRAFRDLAWSSRLPPDLAEAAGERVEPVCRPITRKPIFASEDEIAINPRARSARLRACEKVAA